MEELLSSLSERERKIIRLRFGFDEPPLTLAQIGERMKLTRERIRQIEKQAKDRLRYLVRAKTLEDYLQ
jgi:RNA polymerase sigma factor (sigma-70 family)